MASGDAILAAQAMGADFAYIGTPFIATPEANAVQEYKEMVVASNSDDILYSNAFTGVHGNYLIPSITASGMDLAELMKTSADPSKMNFGTGSAAMSSAKAWKDIWGCGQGCGEVQKIQGAGELVAQWQGEYAAAKKRLLGA